MEAKATATTAAAGPAGGGQAFHEALAQNHLVALWNGNRALLPKESRSRCVPHLWRWQIMWPLVRRAAEVAPLSRAAERPITRVFEG